MNLEIIDLLLKDQVIDKLIWKHNISEVELRQVFNNQPNMKKLPYLVIPACLPQAGVNGNPGSVPAEAGNH
jgi:hypothetical protein